MKARKDRQAFPKIPLAHIALSFVLFVPVLAAFYVAEIMRDARNRKEQK